MSVISSFWQIHYLKLSINQIFKLSVFFKQIPIGIPLRGIVRYCAITAKKEAIKYSQYCEELRGIACIGIAFLSKNQ